MIAGDESTGCGGATGTGVVVLWADAAATRMNTPHPTTTAIRERGRKEATVTNNPCISPIGKTLNFIQSTHANKMIGTARHWTTTSAADQSVKILCRTVK